MAPVFHQKPENREAAERFISAFNAPAFPLLHCSLRLLEGSAPNLAPGMRPALGHAAFEGCGTSRPRAEIGAAGPGLWPELWGRDRRSLPSLGGLQEPACLI